MSIISLGYLVFEASDLAAWSKFSEDVLGLMPAEGGGPGLRYRIDEQAWRIAFTEGARDDVSLAGFEVANKAGLEAVREKLIEGGVEVTQGTSSLCAERGVAELISCVDPDGLVVEIYYGATFVPEVPFRSKAGVRRFVTGTQGLGHIVLSTTRVDELRRFYQDLLGFSLSDIINMGFPDGATVRVEFYFCNPRHHTLALAPMPFPKRVLHFMLQVEEFDDVGFALDRVLKGGATLANSLGRHTNDQMVSFYVRTPSGFDIEYGWGGLAIDPENWRVASYDKPSSWGHAFLGER
ncbi:VOC family protein [Sphingobium phenoxybenzoativorans]|uniref:2,3-dihydroxybiphenyl 1,2 dioxygenase n=1 Tax=Sphingobium phenoxybenzoativorans TaxID=1592790 RepID=A0A1W5YR09_9SPHN|nr:VOC family protein [Sphingobium phenoxybenzoativorans]ARI47598.1 2,3-dihydroxybiphenyl 1,2 dioxygenase [Sphingobium phenoxybenzoativorans]